MAESQVPYPYAAAQLQAIRASLSEPRFSTYMMKAGQHEEYAIALYLYNARVAKAFLYPLSVVEVTVRNAIDASLVSKFGEDWHNSPAFRDQTLNQDGLSTLDKAMARAGQNASRSQIVATLTFDFWSNLFRPDYGDLWRTKLNVAFPNIKRPLGRHEVQVLVKSINMFRNRVAHHEPILDLNVTDIHAQMVQLVELKCAVTAGWMRHHSTLNAIIRSRPKLDGSALITLASRQDADFLQVSDQTTLADILEKVDDKHPAIVCTDSAGAPTAAFTMFDVSRYVSIASKKDGGMIALDEHTVAQLIAMQPVVGRWTAMDHTTALAHSIAELQRPQIRVLGKRQGDPVFRVIAA